MQTILGANGQIAIELAKEINAHYSKDLRLVSRNPEQVNGADQLFSANLLDASKTAEAVSGSSVVYLTVGLPLDAQTWIDQFPPIMRNTIDACKKHRTKLVFFDNTYMYPQNSTPLTEETAFAPVGPKGRVRAGIATMLLDEMKAGNIEAVICRAPEFYGRDKTFSYTNTLLFDPIREHRTPRVLLRDDTLRTLIWSPDASRATALIGNTSDAFNQTWHLPCDDNRRTYKEIIGIAEVIMGEQIPYRVLNKTTLRLVSFFKKPLREMKELLPRYAQDNLFMSDKFKMRFPAFDIKQYQEGIEDMLQ